MAITIAAIRTAIQAGQWRFSTHARHNAVARRIVESDLLAALGIGEIIEDYPADPRGASALVLCTGAAGRPLHAVCTFDPSGTLLIVTTYEPQAPWWVNARTRSLREGHP